MSTKDLNANIHVGCQAWYYDFWVTKRGGPTIFFPEKTKKSEYLSTYAKVFDTVEVNNTFHHIPTVSHVKSWYDQTPPHFKFSLKVPQEITHLLSLRKPAFAVMEKFLVPVAEFREKLAIQLIQLPGEFQPTDVNRRSLEDFLAFLPREMRFAVEFRAAAWFGPEIFQLLAKYDVSLCLGESDYVTRDVIVPALQSALPDTLYLRFGGSRDLLEFDRIQRPQDEALKFWLDQLINLPEKQIYVYFSNFIEGNSPMSAMRFRRMLGQTFTDPASLEPNQSLF